MIASGHISPPGFVKVGLYDRQNYGREESSGTSTTDDHYRNLRDQGKIRKRMIERLVKLTAAILGYLCSVLVRVMV
jgi:hypothetical protein